MVKVGDRIRLSSMKGPDREGLVTAVTGSLMRVRWPSGEETTVVPGPGTLSVLVAVKVAPQKKATKGAAKNTAGATKKDVTSKRDAERKSGATKTKGSKRPLLRWPSNWSAGPRFVTLDLSSGGYRAAACYTERFWRIPRVVMRVERVDVRTEAADHPGVGLDHAVHQPLSHPTPSEIPVEAVRVGRNHGESTLWDIATVKIRWRWWDAHSRIGRVAVRWNGRQHGLHPSLPPVGTSRGSRRGPG